jgi:AcrR family transcriptional regulator
MAAMAAPRRKLRRSSRLPPDLGRRIVDQAIVCAEEVGWLNVRLHVVAERLKVPLVEVRRHHRDLDAVADAWFARALDALLTEAGRLPRGLPVRERLSRLLLAWLDALAPHRRVSADMLKVKLYPFHPHHWGPTIFHLSRTVQWLRDAAGLDAGGRRRQVEEIGLSALLLALLAVWAADETAGQTRTRRFLERTLAAADHGMERVFGKA